MRLTSDSWLKGKYYKPRTDLSKLMEHREGLIVLSACFPEGELALTVDGYTAIESVSQSVYDYQGKMSWNTRTERHYSGEMKEISFESGLSTRCTESHEFLILPYDAWFKRCAGDAFTRMEYLHEQIVYSSDFESGDFALVPLDLARRERSPEVFSRHETFLAGVFLACGSYAYVHQGITDIVLRVPRERAVLLDRIESCVVAIDPDAFVKTNSIIVDGCIVCSVSSRVVYFRMYELFPVSAFNYEVSPYIMNLDLEGRIHALAGYFGATSLSSGLGDSFDNVLSPESLSNSAFRFSARSKVVAATVSRLAITSGISAHINTNKLIKGDTFEGVAHGASCIRCNNLIDHAYSGKKLALQDFQVDTIEFMGIEYLLNRILKIETSHASIHVHCLQVTLSPSFIVNNAVVHNCIGGMSQQLFLEDRVEEAEDHIVQMKNIFGSDYYLEVQYSGLEEQVRVNAFYDEMSRKHELGVVITSDSHYVDRDDSKYHGALVTINTNGRLKKSDNEDGSSLVDETLDTDASGMYYTPHEYFMKSGQDLLDSEQFDAFPNAFSVTNQIADECNVTFIQDGKYIPMMKGIDDEDAELTRVCKEGLVALMAKRDLPEDLVKVYQDRLDHELMVISKMEFSRYFLVVAEYVKWAKDQGILVGGGRGCLHPSNRLVVETGLVPIKDISPGDKVLTIDGSFQKVLEVFRYECVEDLIRIHTNDGCTEGNAFTKDHKIFSIRPCLRDVGHEDDMPRPEWVQAESLSLGDLVFMPSHYPGGSDEDCIEPSRGSWSSIEKLALEEYDGYVYDIKVQNNHNYCTDSFLVHNSAAGSLMAYVSDITNVDPIKYNLLFERR